MPGPSRLPRPPVLSRRALLGAGALGAVALAGCSSAGSGSSGSAATGVAPGTTAPAPSGTASSSSTSPAATAGRAALSEPTDVATGLAVPWSGAVLPDGSVLVSERDTARVKRIPAGGGRVETVGTVEGVDPGGAGGLLALPVDPAPFGTKPVLYAYTTASSDNRVVTIALDG